MILEISIFGIILLGLKAGKINPDTVYT